MNEYLECKDEIARQHGYKDWADLYGAISNIDNGLSHEYLAKNFYGWIKQRGDKYYLTNDKKWHVNNSIGFLHTHQLYLIFKRENKKN